MYEGEIDARPTKRRRRRRRVNIDYSSPEATQKSAARFYESFSPENLEMQVMPVKTYFYVFGFTKKGKKVFLGPYNHLDADTELAKLDDGEIFEYITKDLKRATSQMKAELMSRGEDADEALQRVLHKIPLIGRKK